MLRIVPKSLFNWTFKIFQGGQPIAVIDRSMVREAGELILEEAYYKLYREGLINGRYLLERDDAIVAWAEKPSAFRNVFEVNYGEQRYVLKKKSAFLRLFLLELEGRTVGTMRPVRAFTRTAEADFPDHLPVAVQVFMVWLVLILWKRASDGAS